jgi:hypothetical protein
LEGRVKRPNDAKVADNGAFVLNDWLFTAEVAGSSIPTTLDLQEGPLEALFKANERTFSA